MLFGFLSEVLALFPLFGLNVLPATLDPSAWYSGHGFSTLAIFAAIALYSFRTSLGGRPFFGTARLDE